MTKSRPMADRPLFEVLLYTLDSSASVRSVLIGALPLGRNDFYPSEEERK